MREQPDPWGSRARPRLAQHNTVQCREGSKADGGKDRHRKEVTKKMQCLQQAAKVPGNSVTPVCAATTASRFFLLPSLSAVRAAVFIWLGWML